jgi:hypothetical protein
MITAIVKVKRAGHIEITDAIGFSAKNIQESFEEMYGDDEEVVVIDVMVQA